MIAGDRRIKGSCCCCCRCVRRQGSGGHGGEPRGEQPHRQDGTNYPRPRAHLSPRGAPTSTLGDPRSGAGHGAPSHAATRAGTRRGTTGVGRVLPPHSSGVTVPRCVGASKRRSGASAAHGRTARRAASRHTPHYNRPHAARRHAQPHTRITRRNKLFPAQRRAAFTPHPPQHQLTSCPAGGTVFTPPRPPPP